jgi:hypothetical protein
LGREIHRPPCSEAIAAIVGAQPSPASSLQPGISPPLERLIERCLAKKRQRRWQTVATSIRVTFRRGAVSSARFTPDGQSFVYSSSWEGNPYNLFLGRSDGLDARDLSLPAGRILSISSTNDMAVLFGPQNVVQAFGARTLARVPLAGGARRQLIDGVVDADWIAGTNEVAVVRDPGNGRPLRVEFPLGTVVHEARAAWSLRVSPDGTRVAFFEGPGLFAIQPEAMVTVVDRSGRKSTLARNRAGTGLAWSRMADEIWFTATDGSRQAPWLQSVSLGRGTDESVAESSSVASHLHQNDASRDAGHCEFWRSAQPQSRLSRMMR